MTNLDVFDSLEIIPEKIPTDKHGLRYVVVPSTANSGMTYYLTCPWDGSALTYVIECRYAGMDNPYPAYLLECPVCSHEREIV